MSFLIKYDELRQKYNKIWDTQYSNSIKKGFYSEPVCNETYLKTKIKCYEGTTSTHFYEDEVPKEGFHCVCLSEILIDSAFKIGKNYYTHLFLEG